MGEEVGVVVTWEDNSMKKFITGEENFYDRALDFPALFKKKQ